MQYEGNKFHDINVKEINCDWFLNSNEDMREERTVSLSEILQGEKVVLYYTRSACNSCISEQFALLNKLKKKIRQDHIIILADYVEDNVRLYLKSNNIDIRIYEFGDKKTGLVQVSDVPALLFLTSGDSVVTSFVLDMDTKYYADYFYQFVEKKFIKEKE
jgi:thiol-disulfide isomerase/thioredoxin